MKRTKADTASVDTSDDDAPILPASKTSRKPEVKRAEAKQSKRPAGASGPPITRASTPLSKEELSRLQTLKELVKPHVESFNFFLEKDTGALALGVQTLGTQLIDAQPDNDLPAVRFWLDKVTVGIPTKSDSLNVHLYPNECRELGISYSAPLVATFVRQVEGRPAEAMQRKLGDLPIMVKSAHCHLQHMTPDQLVSHREEALEMGGYFIVAGIERLVRLLILPRRNHVSTLLRPSYANRGKGYTGLACAIRCVRPDQSGKTVTLHYLSDGSANVRISIRKQEMFIPAIYLLKAFTPTTDREIYEQIVQGNVQNAFVTDRAELLIRDGHKTNLYTQSQIINHLGSMFRVLLRPEPSVTDYEVGQMLLDEHLFVHIEGHPADKGRKKFDLLIFMIQKLYALAEGRIMPDNSDALNSHEILMPGHLYSMILKEKLQEWLAMLKATIYKDIRTDPKKVEILKDAYWKKCMDQLPDIGRKMEYFLKTGNLVSSTGLDMQQTTGFTIIADKLNWTRYMSHFRSVHRGQFFAQMKTTTVRKLLPESWGFVCPVHTPDGAPCGLLNHLASRCDPVTHMPKFDRKRLINLCVDLGMTATQHPPVVLPHDYLPVLLDGIVIGRIAPNLSKSFAFQLRLLKVKSHPDVPSTIEIFSVHDMADYVYPAIELATDAGRLIRPVRFLPTKNDPNSYIEWIGPMEQVFMDIACTEDDFREGETTHMEIMAENFLSETGRFTPFSDFNQSPRNMYQCQMGKQTMGTPIHSLRHRTDNKLYRLQNPQMPLVRNEAYKQYSMDDYPAGTNAVVAVISYTGYDMEDAMILNKSAFERGFGHASVYAYKKVDLEEKRIKGEPIHHHFSNIVPEPALRRKQSRADGKEKEVKLADPKLDLDGLPYVSGEVRKHDPLYAVWNDVDNRVKTQVQKEYEQTYVEEIRVLGGPDNQKEIQRVGIKLRIPRNPVIGDKFSSRHGQKGVMSVLWPSENMPFTESGMQPDVIINPHAFPSRMTIGMLVESMAGKAGALHGKFHDGSPFRFSEDFKATEYFGQQMLAAGYSYHGTEPMYSGITGVEMQAHIFIGVVYYQRLRHMVSDKSQVRATGPVNSRHRQPIKGRKVHGGIRFGEMERDSLLAHGTSFLLHDRLMMCSDYHTGYVCTLCGSVLSPVPVTQSTETITTKPVSCRNCDTSRGCQLLAIPYVFIFLANELAAMNIRLTLAVK